MSLKNIVDPIIQPGLDVVFKSIDAASLDVDTLNTNNIDVINIQSTGVSTLNVVNANKISVSDKLFVKSGNTVLSTSNPNNNSSNDLDVYGVLGMSLANTNTYYGINLYFDGSNFKTLRNGYSANIKQDGGSGDLIFSVSTANTVQDGIIPFGPSMILDKTGILSIGNKIKSLQSYIEYRNTVVQSIPSTSGVPMELNTSVVSVGSGITFSANTFNISQAGIYNISWYMLWAPVNVGYRRSFLITNNGIVYGDITNVPDSTTGNCSISSSCMIKFNANDSFQIIIYQTNGVPVNTLLQNASVYQLPSLF